MLQLKYPKFAALPTQDPDDHCIVFEETYYLNNPAHILGALGVAEQLHMK